MESQHILKDLIHILGCKGVKTLRIFNVYDVEGLSEEEELELGRGWSFPSRR